MSDVLVRLAYIYGDPHKLKENGQTIAALMVREARRAVAVRGHSHALKTERDVERLREDYRDLLCAHPDRQYRALQAYLGSSVDGRRTIEAAREEISSA